MTEAKRKEKFRNKMKNNNFNPVMEIILSLIVLFASPLLWFWSLLHDRVMMKLLNKHYIYNVSWEDPRIDHRVMHLTEKDHVLTIASAGCNVLDYIIEGCKVTAVDFNACQIALTELKAVCIQQMDFDDFFEVFGRSNMSLLREHYQTKLRQHLSSSSAEFWDHGVHDIKSLMYSGSSGGMAYFLFRIVFPLCGMGWVRRLVKRGATAEEFRAEAYKHDYTLRFVAWILDNLLMYCGSWAAGVPQRQLNLGIHRKNNLATVLDRVFFQLDLVHDNYFYAGYILGEYTPTNCPRYLKREHYASLRKNLRLGKLNLYHGPILDALKEMKKDELITVASLLDHMDWMTERQINQELCHLTAKMDRNNGRLFWRSFSENVHAAPLVWLNPTKVADEDDRVGMYFSTWLADLKQSNIVYEERVDSWKESKVSLWSLLVTGAQMVTFPIWQTIAKRSVNSAKKTGVSGVTGSSSRHAVDMESFYSCQKEGYDNFREGLLHARPILMESMPLRLLENENEINETKSSSSSSSNTSKSNENGKLVWIDIGGGTARNLEFFPIDVIRNHFKKIVIVDISASLLQIATRRVEEMGLGDIVEIVEHDATAESVFDVLPACGTVDIVTMSYSFSMIPAKATILRNSLRLLKSETGLLGIADFWAEGKYDDGLPTIAGLVRRLEGWLHCQWFKHDRVFLLNSDMFAEIEEGVEIVWDDRFRGAIPFLPFFQPYHGVLFMKKL